MGSTVDRDLQSGRGRSEALSSLRANRHAAWFLLAGGESGHTGVVQVGLVDRAGIGDSVGPVDVAAVHRHPGRGALAGEDGVRVAAVQVGLVDRAAGAGPVEVVAVYRHPERAVHAG